MRKSVLIARPSIFDCPNHPAKKLLDNIVRPAIYCGYELQEYGVHRITGDIYSFKQSNYFPKKLSWAHRNPKNLKVSYPCLRITDSSIFPDHHNQGLTINVHILVHETLTPIPVPPGVTTEEWRRTPVAIKRMCRGLWMINHIDHNKLNFKPNNLEWVFGAKENAQRAKKFYAANLT